MSATPWDLDELRRLEKEATPAGSPGRSCFYKPGDLVAMGVTKQNATFLVALRNAAGAGMLDRLAELEAFHETTMAEAVRLTARDVGPTHFSSDGASLVPIERYDEMARRAHLAAGAFLAVCQQLNATTGMLERMAKLETLHNAVRSNPLGAHAIAVALGALTTKEPR